MVSSRLISGVVLLGVLAAAPTLAADGQRRRSGGDSGDGRAEEQGQQAGRAVPRSRAAAPQGGSPAQAQQAQVQAQVQRQYQASPQVQRQYQAAPQVQAQRQYRSDQNDYRGDGRAYAVPREYQRPYYPSYSSLEYGPLRLRLRIWLRLRPADGSRTALHHASFRHRRACTGRTSIVRASASASTMAAAVRIHTATRRAGTTIPSLAGRMAVCASPASLRSRRFSPTATTSAS